MTDLQKAIFQAAATITAGMISANEIRVGGDVEDYSSWAVKKAIDLYKTTKYLTTKK